MLSGENLQSRGKVVGEGLVWDEEDWEGYYRRMEEIASGVNRAPDSIIEDSIESGGEATLGDSPEATALRKLGAEAREELAMNSDEIRRVAQGAIEEMVRATREIMERSPNVLAQAVEEFKLPQKEIVSLLKLFPPEKQEELLANLGIPDLRRVSPKVTERKMKTSFERKEMAETEKELDSLSGRLLRAVEEAYPERKEIERERAQVESQLKNKIKKIREIGYGKEGGVTKPLLVKIEGLELPAVYKPMNRDLSVHGGVKLGDFWRREWLAGRIDMALGLDIIPPTVGRDGPEGWGTVQAWELGRPGALTEGGWRNSDPDLMERIGFFDAITGNNDRHPGNWVGKKAIDNGGILAKKVWRRDGLRSYPLELVGKNGVSEKILDKARRFMESKEVVEALHQAFLKVLRPEAEKRWQEFIEQIDTIIETGEYPGNDWLLTTELMGKPNAPYEPRE